MRSYNSNTRNSSTDEDMSIRNKINNPIEIAKKSSIVYLEPVKYKAGTGSDLTIAYTETIGTTSGGSSILTGLQITIGKTGAFTGITTSHKAQFAEREVFYNNTSEAYEHSDEHDHWLGKETIVTNYVTIKTAAANEIVLTCNDLRYAEDLMDFLEKMKSTDVSTKEREAMFLYILPLNYSVVRKKKSSIIEYFYDNDRTAANKDLMFIRDDSAATQKLIPAQWDYDSSTSVGLWQGLVAKAELVNSASAWTEYGVYHNIIPTLDEIFENDN